MMRVSLRVGCALISGVLISATYANVDQRPAGVQMPWVVPGFEEPLVPVEKGFERDKDLLETVEAYERTPDDVAALERYVAEHPASPWNAAILTNLGLVYYRTGYFSKAIDALEQAWQRGRGASDEQAKALTDRAIGELLRMHARLGHAERVAELLEQVKDRPIVGSASEAVSGAAGGLWLMRNEPGLAYLCGPMALKSLAQADVHAPTATINALEDYRSGPQGVSLGEVGALAKKLGLPYQPVFRRSGAIPVPSVVHWKLNHYAAIVAERDGWYQVQDPTFGAELWLEADAINAESSGYFLVRNELAVDGLRNISRREASRIYGMGNTTLWSPNGPNGCSVPMCTYSFQPTLISLNVSDTPVGYAPPIGPAMYTTLSYSQRDTRPPALPTFFNFGPKWTSNWLSYVVDNPRSPPGTGVSRYLPGGGGYDYVGFNKETGTFTPESTDLSVLVRIAEPLHYERRLGDGSKEIYAASDGSAAFPRRFFVTERIDARGNRILFDYDDKRRLTSITDATKRKTTFAYAHPTNPLLVTGISDPFGRTAKIGYGGDGRLTEITDVIGITSSLTYDPGGFVTGLITPYGVTRFSYKEVGVNRSLEATDPLGFTERIEFRHGAPGIPTVERVWPKGMSVDSRWMQFRNTFYWDKLAFREGAGDYTKAHITHWFHQYAGVAARTIESIKPPLERRIWFNNPGSVLSMTGTYDVPSAVGRVLDDGTSQVSRITYNERGNMTSTTDPVGRTTIQSYAPNQIDVMAVAQKTGDGEYSTIAQFSYDTRHLPVTATDASGQTTHFVYDAAGQVSSVTDALGHKTRYEYDSLGYLQRVINPNEVVVVQFTYDAFGRVATRTDSEGYSIAMEYDVLDRPTKVTYPDATSDLLTWNRLDLTSVVDRQGRSTFFEYDANRNRTAIVDSLKRRTQFSYYPNGVLESITDANDNKTTWLRDLQSRAVAKVYPDGLKYQYEYEPSTGRLKSTTDALGQQRRVSYTVDGRVAAVSYAGTAADTSPVTFDYDPVYPRMRSMKDGVGTTSYTYLPVGTLGAMGLATEDGPFERDSVAYQYDAIGRVVRRTTDQSAESWELDALGRVTRHSSLLGEFVLEYSGQTKRLASETGDKVGTKWAFDASSSDRALKNIDFGSFGLEYVTKGGLITGIVERHVNEGGAASRAWNYAYDGANRLTQATTSNGVDYAYNYDAADNLASVRQGSSSTVGTYTSTNQIAEFGGAPFVYDAEGSLKEDTLHAYSWDAEGRLLGIAYKNEPTRRTEFRYDGYGRRLSAVEATDGHSIETRYLWCGSAVCQARSGDDVVTRRYYTEGEVVGDDRLYYARDHLGSVRATLKVSDGQLLESRAYSAYGETIDDDQTLTTDRGFAGMERHAPSGLYLTRYRAYDPKTGRWLSRDPLEELGGPNAYTYAGAQPTVSTDPLGLLRLVKRGVVENYAQGDASWQAQVLTLETAAGNEIEGREMVRGSLRIKGQKLPPPFDPDGTRTLADQADPRYNCFGSAFANGEYWIGGEGDEIDTLLNDEYYRVGSPRPGDVVIYRALPTDWEKSWDDPGQVVHATTYFGEVAGVPMSLGKSGTQFGPRWLPVAPGPDGAWSDPSAQIEYYTPKDGLGLSPYIR